MRYSPIYGTVRSIMPLQNSNENYICTLILSMMSKDMGTVNFFITPNTYVLEQQKFYPGDPVIAFYDTQTPIALIYPPRFTAIILAGNCLDGFAAFDYFDKELINSDQTLKLNLDYEETNIVLSNGQTFTGNPGGNYLLVLYTITTRSIPPVTVPEKVVVFCDPMIDNLSF